MQQLVYSQKAISKEAYISLVQFQVAPVCLKICKVFWRNVFGEVQFC